MKLRKRKYARTIKNTSDNENHDKTKNDKTHDRTKMVNQYDKTIW